jgi:hypothetical protein
MRRIRLVPLGVSMSLIIISFGYISYECLSDIIRESKYAELKSISDFKKQLLVSWYTEKLNDIITFAQSPFFSDAVKKWENNKNDFELRQKILEKIGSNLSDKDYKRIILFSTNKEILLFAGCEEYKPDAEVDKLIPKTIVSKSIQSTNLYISAVTGEINFDFLVPVISSGDSSCIAILLFSINPNITLFPTIQSWPVKSKTSESLILRLEKDSVVFLNELRHKKDAALKFKISVTKTSLPAVQAILGKTGFYEGIDYRGNNILSYIDQMPQTKWYIVSKVDKSELFHQIKVYTIIMIAFIILLLMLTNTIIFLYFRTLQKNTYQKLYEVEKELMNAQKRFQ